MKKQEMELRNGICGSWLALRFITDRFLIIRVIYSQARAKEVSFTFFACVWHLMRTPYH